jgi:hypothetical protein
VGAAVLLRGGYFHGGRAAFVLLAGCALVAAILRDDLATLRFLRSPPVLVTAGLGALTVLSAAWTVGERIEAVSLGMAVLGLAAVMAAAGVAGRFETSERIALAIAVVAAAAAVAGLLGVALREGPWGDRIGGSWRPGGPFEYPPALALLQVSALPALLRWMVRARTVAAGPSALAAALVGAVLSLSGSRLQVGLAGLVALAALAWPWATVGAGRARTALAIAIPAGAGAAAAALAGGYAPPAATGGDVGRLIGLAAIVTGAALAWLLACRVVPDRTPRTLPRSSLLIAGAAAVLALAAFAASPPVSGDGGFTHGRLGLWGDAVATAADRPVLGAGGHGFLFASEERQGDTPTRYAHNLPLELAVELGIAGLLLALALYATTGAALLRARGSPALWLLGPAVAAFPLANLVDWPWHLAGCGAVWALALGGLMAAAPPRPRAAAGTAPARS